MRTVACRGCGQMIGFIKNQRSGKNMPVDPELVALRDLDPGGTIVDDQGMIHKSKFGTVQDDGIEGYVPHWISCPNAEEFRKTKNRDS